MEVEPENAAIDVEVVERLMEILVNEAFGCFYEFNDSEVKPMTLTDTKKAFEGHEFLVSSDTECADEVVSTIFARNDSPLQITKKISHLP
jgi:hypothetical protein